MRKGAMVSKIFGIALVFVMIGSMFGGVIGTAAAAKFNIGDTVEVTDNLNVRTGPGTNYPEITDPDYPGYAPAGTIGKVLSGPSGGDGYTWWEVDYGPGLYSGWSVEDWLEKVSLPDLIVEDIWIEPAEFGPGDTVNLGVRIKNVGDVDAGGFVLKRYLDGSYVAPPYGAEGLGAGWSTTLPTSWDLSWPSDCNSHMITVVIDADGWVDESDEGNNEKSEPFNATNQPPYEPYNPFPYDGEPGVSIYTDLSWSGGDPDVGDTVTYDVYFEKGDSTPDQLKSNDQPGTTYDPGTLDPTSHYYWQIVAKDNHGATTPGPVWDFTTGEGPNQPPYKPYSPSPYDGKPGVSIYTDLSWSGGDPDVGDTVTYDVYFEKGDSSPDQLESDDQTGITYDPGTLDPNSHYYWQIVAKDNHGATTPGDIWDFTTGEGPNQPPILSSGNVTPGSGNTSTVFNYYVTYTDPDGDAPTTKYVYVDGSSETMTKISGDYTSGATFKYSTTLSEGSYNYRFYFDDGHGHTVWLPTSGTYPGPSVSGVNQDPILSSGNVTPISGNTSTVFNYYVTYTDSDGDAPTTKYVYVDGSPKTMTKISGDYTSGATFKYSTTLSAGSYNYSFYFDDGHGHTVWLPPSGIYPGPSVSGPNQPPDCVIELREEGTASQIDKVDVGQFFDIFVGNSTDDTGITEVRFSSDNFQDDISTGEWTGWYDWDASSGAWNATSKVRKWSFATPGIKEVWAEVRDSDSNIDRCCANIFVHPGYAVIVAGQGRWWAWGEDRVFDHCANNAYRVLRNSGFDDDHIYYLNSRSPQDIDGDGDSEIDATALLTPFEDAMNEVRGKIGDSSIPFILYLMGHGNIDFFEFDGDAGTEGFLWVSRPELLGGGLQEMLGEFSSETPMLIVINSCYSGSFINSTEESPGSISDPNRIIITTAHDDEGRNVFGGARSSDRFFGNLNEGLNVKDAFIRHGLPGDWWHLWLDDNGDKTGHPPNNLADDGDLATSTKIGVTGTENLKLTPWLLVWKHSPGELRVYDSQNRVTGLVNGEVRQEIPDSLYDEQNEVIGIFLPSDTYHYEVAGTEAGAYGLEVSSIEDGNATTVAAVDVPTSPNATHNYTINWTALSQGAKAVTIQIDSDGDGEFEQTINTTPPNEPSNLAPSDSAANIPLDAVLSWTGSDPDGDNVTYKVYFGTNEDPPLVSDNQTETSYSPASLNYTTKYYWRVVARDEHGMAAESPVWQFTTLGVEVDSEWGKVDTPSMENWKVATGSDLYMPALGIDGQTIYVIGSMWVDENADGWIDYTEETARLWKSEDGGATWDDITGNVMKEICDQVYGSDETIPWTDMVAWFNFVTVPLDDSSFIVLGAYLGNIIDPINWQQVVLVSENGGEEFELLPYPIQDKSAGTNGTNLTDIYGINISPDVDIDGVRNIAICGIEDPDRSVVNPGTPNGNEQGRVYRFRTGGLTGGSWEDAVTDKPGWKNCTAVTWVYFSGQFVDDDTLMAVTHNTKINVSGCRVNCFPYTGNQSYFQTGTWSGSNVNWNEAASRGEAALLSNDPVPWWTIKGSSSGIGLPLDYDGNDKNARYAWVTLNTAKEDPVLANQTCTGTIYRVINGDAVPVTQQVEGQPWLAMVFYFGTIDEGKAVAGLLGKGSALGILGTITKGLGLRTEDCEGVQVYRNDGISDMDICCQAWQPACKPPTGHGGAMAIIAPPGGTKVYCVTTALTIGMNPKIPGEIVPNCHMWDKYDEGAFSVSFDEGDTWNQIGLIDTDMDYLTDVAQSPDCNTTYLASMNINLPGERSTPPSRPQWTYYGVCDSVFFKSKNLAEEIPQAGGYDDKWFRVWNAELTNNTPLNGADTPEIGLIRLAPEETGEIETVYFVDRGSDTVYYDGNKGLGCWETGSSTVDQISDLAVQDEATIYAVGFNGDVAVSDSHGALWSNTMDSKVDDGHTIAVDGEGNVLVGGADGKVAYSDSDLATFMDGEASFTELKDGLGSGRVHVAFDSYFDANSVIYAAVSVVDVNASYYETPVNDADNGIYRWVIGESTVFEDLGECPGTATPTETQLGLGPSCDKVEVGYYGIVLDRAEGNPETDATSGGVLYATFFDADGYVTGVARCLNPAEEVACGEADWDYLIEDVNEYHGAFTVEPSSLEICGCLTPDTNSKLWAIDDALYYNGIVVEEDPRYIATLGRLWIYAALEISVSPSNLTFVTRCGENPADQTLEVCNSRSGTLNWSLSDNAGWLSESPAGGSLGEGECEDMTVSVNTSGMAAGLYSANITITGSANVTIPVTLEIKPAPIDVMRNLPDVTYPGQTFDVYVNFTAPVDKFNAISLTDLAPDGWNVTVNATWCTPNADAVLATGNKAELGWFGEPGVGFDNGTPFTVMYKVTIPDDAELGINEFPLDDCSKAGLGYYVGSQGPYTSCVIGEHEMTVTVTIDIIRNLPADALDFDAEYPGDTFDVYVNFTAPVDDFNGISLTDYAPAGWEVETNVTWCTPIASWTMSPYNKAEYAWSGPFSGGTNFSAKYKVTIPATAIPGSSYWPNCTPLPYPPWEGSPINNYPVWLEYWFGAEGPYESCITGERQKIVTVPGCVVGETRDVNGDMLLIPLDTVLVELYETPAVWEDNDSSIIVGNVTQYQNCADDTGFYWQYASRTCYYPVNSSAMPSTRNPNYPLLIDWSTPEKLAAGYTMNFVGDYGLVCKAATMSYAMESVNHWLYTPVDEYGTPQPDWKLSNWKAMQSVHSWQFPCGCRCSGDKPVW